MNEGPRPLLIVAYAVAPGRGGAEALVNGGLVDALDAAGDELTVVAASPPGTRPGDPVRRVGDTATGPLRSRVAGWLDIPRRRPLGAVARLVDRGRSLGHRAPLRTLGWAKAASVEIEALRARPGWDGSVVWARATPPESFEAVIRAHRARPFPLVANYNDPMPPGPRAGGGPGSTERALHHLQRRQNRYLARHADAWTFPSTALRDLMVERADLDPRRCFVIPHVVPARAASPRPVPTGPPRLLYAGTLYRWLFDGPLGEVLPAWTADGRVQLVVAAARARPADLRAVRDRLPGAEIHQDLDAPTLDALVEGVDAVLIVDNRPPLLPTKVVDGVRRLRPLLAVAPGESTTTTVVRGAGGITADRGDAAAIESALIALTGLLADPSAIARCRRQQTLAAERFSDRRVVADVRAVLDFAARHFDAWSAASPEPEPPALAADP